MSRSSTYRGWLCMQKLTQFETFKGVLGELGKMGCRRRSVILMPVCRQSSKGWGFSGIVVFRHTSLACCCLS